MALARCRSRHSRLHRYRETAAGHGEDREAGRRLFGVGLMLGTMTNRAPKQSLNPHGEEARSAVSNHEAPLVPFILRDARRRAPQDEVRRWWVRYGMTLPTLRS